MQAEMKYNGPCKSPTFPQALPLITAAAAPDKHRVIPQRTLHLKRLRFYLRCLFVLQISAYRPGKLKDLPKTKKTVNRIYGGHYSHAVVKER